MRQRIAGRLYDSPQAPIWTKSEVARNRIVRKVCETLIKRFGRPRLSNPRDPVDDLIFLMLSNRTQEAAVRTVYDSLKAFGSWDDVSELPQNAIRMAIQIAGLSRKRSQQIKQSLKRIRTDFGVCRLGELRKWNTQRAHEYLTALPGVSDKVAKCVMMYTLGFKVLPVDVHVFRVSSRLGWTSRCRADQCHDDLEALVPPPLRYAFHVDCIVLGRTICTPRVPNCHACAIRKFCSYYRQRNEPPRET